MEEIHELHGVERTLLAALKVKKDEFYHPQPILKDPLAKDIFESLRLDENEFKLNRHSATAALFRARKIDQWVTEFMEANPDGLVIDLGCGLDPRFSRLDNGQITWIDIDFPEVIRLRKKFFQENPRYRMIGKSILDFSWFDDALPMAKGKIIIVAEGVLPYLEKAQFLHLFQEISVKFPRAFLVFDLCSELLTRKKFVRILKKAGTVLHWGVNDTRELINPERGLGLLEEWRYYDQFQQRYGISNFFHFIPALNNIFRIVKCQFLQNERISMNGGHRND
ncbi:MAG TPA: class I SAM-dependent methyltransferase [Bacillota bacterium]|nr:class I SAM-dependent methyltransferase [Bacillota bacterium]